MLASETTDRIQEVQHEIEDLAASLAARGEYQELSRLLKILQEDADQIRCVVRE